MSELVTFQHRDFHWQVAAHLRPILFDSDGIALEKWHAQNCVHVIKHGDHRTVVRVSLPEVSFYLKHYPKPDIRAWFRQLVRPSKARVEYDKAVAIAARGIPTIAPLAIGERASWLGSGESYIVTQEIAGTVPLHEFLTSQFPALPANRKTHLRKRLADNLGVFMAQLHNAGVRHNDLHAGNILVRVESDDEPSLFLIDLHAVTVSEPLDWANSCDNLVLCNRWFSVFAERSDRSRFWRAYCRHRTLKTQPHDFRARARNLEHATWRSNLEFCRRQDRRSMKTNRHFRRVHNETCSGFAVTSIDPEFVDELAANPDAPFSAESAHILKDSPTSTIAEINAPCNGRTTRVIWKRITAKKWGDSCRALLRQSAIWRSWTLGHGLLNRAVPTAKPLIVLHRRRAGWPGHGYLLTEKIDNAQELHRYLESLALVPGDKQRRQINQLIAKLANLIRNIHRWCLSHRDLKASNILVRADQSQTDDFAIWFIDLVGVRRWKDKVPKQRRVKDLARLNASCVQQSLISRTDRLRFLRCYLECAWKGRQNWKVWWNAIAKATARKMAQNEKRGRLLA